jgi:ferritin
MISKEMQKELNRQVNEELYSAYLYLAMSADFTHKNLNGFAQWLRVQAHEEVNHAMRFYKYIHERRGEVELEQIGKPKAAWESPLDAFTSAFKHEQHITARINGLLDLAHKEKDPATAEMLQWFVKEQVEEEASADEIVQKLSMAGDNVGALMIIDQAVGQRK